MRDKAVQRLFSLFTSADRAEAITGDLAEERARHGWIWFWLQVARTTLALWRQSSFGARPMDRNARFYPMMEAAGIDVKLGLRLMRKSWGLTLVGGVAMAVTIGLGTSILTIWNTATTTTLPLPAGDRIVAIQRIDAATQRIHRDSSLQDLTRWREQLRSVSDVSAMRRVQHTLVTPDGGAAPISGAEMTASAFRVAGVPPALGRPLLDEDERGGANVVVIGFRVWQEGFSSDPAVLGRRVRLDDVDYTVVGVMPETFAFPVSQRIWIPLRTNPLDYPGGQIPDVFVFARLTPGFTQERAQAEVAALERSRASAANVSLRPRVVPYVAGVLSWTRAGAGSGAWSCCSRRCCSCPRARTSAYWSTRGPSRGGGVRDPYALASPEDASARRFSSRSWCWGRRRVSSDCSSRAS